MAVPGGHEYNTMLIETSRQPMIMSTTTASVQVKSCDVRETTIKLNIERHCFLRYISN